MAKVVFTLPGKIGDSFLEWPAAYYWHQETKEPFDVVVGAGIRNIIPLLYKQPGVDRCLMSYAIQNYDIGGQPWDFAGEVEGWETVYHLGLRKFPQSSITRETMEHVPVTAPEVYGQCIFMGKRKTRSICVLHYARGRTSYLEALDEIIDLLRERFGRIICVGMPNEREQVRLSTGCEEFDDNQSWIAVAKLLNKASLVVGSASSIAALGGAMGIPTVRINHYPHPRTVTPWTYPSKNYLDTDLIRVRNEIVPFMEEWCGHHRKPSRQVDHSEPETVEGRG